jgi:hypothetical protein
MRPVSREIVRLSEVKDFTRNEPLEKGIIV